MLTLEVYKVSPYIMISIWINMPAKVEQNCMVQTTQNFELFDKKPSVLKPFLTSVDAIL